MSSLPRTVHRCLLIIVMYVFFLFFIKKKRNTRTPPSLLSSLTHMQHIQIYSLIKSTSDQKEAYKVNVFNNKGTSVMRVFYLHFIIIIVHHTKFSTRKTQLNVLRFFFYVFQFVSNFTSICVCFLLEYQMKISENVIFCCLLKCVFFKVWVYFECV